MNENTSDIADANIVNNWDRASSLFQNSRPFGALVFLHDCGESGPAIQALLGHLWGDHESGDFEEAMAKFGFVVLFPSAPERERYGNRIHSWLDRDNIFWPSEEKTINLEIKNELDRTFSDIVRIHDIPPHRIVVGGIGSGAAAALYYSTSNIVGGTFAINSFLPTQSNVWDLINIKWIKQKTETTLSQEQLDLIQNNQKNVDENADQLNALNESEEEEEIEEDETEEVYFEEESESSEDENIDSDEDLIEYEFRQNKRKEEAMLLSLERRSAREARMKLRQEMQSVKLELRQVKKLEKRLQKEAKLNIVKENIFKKQTAREEALLKLRIEDETTDLNSLFWHFNHQFQEENDDKGVHHKYLSHRVLFLHGVDNNSVPLGWADKTAQGLSVVSKVNFLPISGGHELSANMLKCLLSWIQEVVKEQDHFKLSTDSTSSSTAPLSSTEHNNDDKNINDDDDDDGTKTAESVPLPQSSNLPPLEPPPSTSDLKIINSEMTPDPFKIPFTINTASKSLTNIERHEHKITFKVPIGWEASIARYPISARGASFPLNHSGCEAGSISADVVSTDPIGTAEAIRVRIIERLNDLNPPNASECILS